MNADVGPQKSTGGTKKISAEGAGRVAQFPDFFASYVFFSHSNADFLMIAYEHIAAFQSAFICVHLRFSSALRHKNDICGKFL